MGAEKAAIEVGDFVEAVFIGDPAIIRRGVVISVLNPKTVVVKGRDFESLCENPRQLELSQLSGKERNLYTFLVAKSKRRKDAGGDFSRG